MYSVVILAGKGIQASSKCQARCDHKSDLSSLQSREHAFRVDASATFSARGFRRTCQVEHAAVPS